MIWVQGGGRCAICRDVLYEKGCIPAFTHLIGEVAHIVAEERDGPRGQSSLSLEERNAEPNLMLLCLKHHKIIDDDPVSYPVEKLQKTKSEHAKWVTANLSNQPAWDTKLFQLYYINIPRLSLLTAQQGIILDTSAYGPLMSLRNMGRELSGLMADFNRVLQKTQMRAVPLELAVRSQDPCGMVVSFNEQFRTKNINIPESNPYSEAIFSGNLKKDPHICCKLGDCKVVMNIDHRWITTSTALCHFRPSSGRNRFAGLGFINSHDAGADILGVTPFVIGMPSNPLMEAFYGGDC